MAEKKYLDTTGLGQYDAKIKALIDAKDAATLTSAKSYADGLASNYEAAGSISTAQAALEAKIAEEKTRAEGKESENATAAAAAKTAADNAAAAASAADEKAQAAQDDVDALETYVGTIPTTSSAASVVAYVDEKTAGIATDAALEGLTNRVTAAEGKITAAEGDIDTLQSEMDAVEAKVTTLVGEDSNKSVRTIANEELAAQLIPENAQESLDTLQEIAAWIQEHPGDASAMNAAIEALQAKVTLGVDGDEEEYATVKAYVEAVIAAEKNRAEAAEGNLASDIAALEAKFGEGDGSVSDMIADAVAAEKAAREAADTAHDTAIAAAKQAGDDAQADVDALETVVEGKAAQTDLESAVSRIGANETAITALRGASHTHDNKTVLDTITAQLTSQWSEAYTKAHEHSNKDALDTVTTAKISAWDNAEGNAKTYTDEKIAEFVTITSDEIDALFA